MQYDDHTFSRMTSQITRYDTDDILLKGKTHQECWLEVGEETHAAILRQGIPPTEANPITHTILGLHDTADKGWNHVVELLNPANQENLRRIIGLAKGQIHKFNQPMGPRQI